MKALKNINLLEEFYDDILKFQTRKWYIINDQNNGQYGRGDENGSTIKCNISVIMEIHTFLLQEI